MRCAGAVAIVLTGLAAAGCGSGSNSGAPSSSSNILTRTNKVQGCSSLREQDVVRVSGFTSLHRVDFAFPEGEGILCSTGYSSGAVSAVVTITERSGGTRALRQLRSSRSSEFGARAIQPVPELGDGAFVAARRYLAFLHAGRAVSLETGLGDSGKLVLTARQLIRLAQAVH
jgi:hypothetical protein